MSREPHSHARLAPRARAAAVARAHRSSGSAAVCPAGGLTDTEAYLAVRFLVCSIQSSQSTVATMVTLPMSALRRRVLYSTPRSDPPNPPAAARAGTFCAGGCSARLATGLTAGAPPVQLQACCTTVGLRYNCRPWPALSSAAE